MHVGVVGGGISGLYSALLLIQQGFQVTLFEATNRLGGRIYTYHFPPSTLNDDPYFEAGAMRIPCTSIHRPVFNLTRHLNQHTSREMRIEFIPYIMTHENNIVFVRGKKRKAKDISLAAELGLPDEYCNQSAQDLLKGAIGEWMTLLANDFEAGFKCVLQYDEMSFRQYLRQVVQWPHQVIDFVEMMTSQTNQYDLSFTEVILQYLDFGTKEWVTIKGGMSRLIDAIASLVGAHNIHRNAAVREVHTSPGKKVSLVIQGASSTITRVFDRVIMAIPLSSLKNMLERPRWSFVKEQAISATYYEPLYKMGVHFRSRFWETFATPCFGGQSMTDLRVRWVIYPSNDLGANRSGVLLLYSWMADAARWSAMPFEDRVQLALHDLRTLFAGEDEALDVYEEFIEAFDISWSCHSSTGGCMYLPGQFSRFSKEIGRCEGNIYFAGEHLSLHHAWITGAISSASTAVNELLLNVDKPRL
ncbi:putative flavin-containing amine oxidase [Aspergillus nomiae NRRL 13137]|uniref:Amine oxidase n=1 Tax=Aspergillus nomiae NRRL (strain ATCC 15546 / NRRL 13137 / CBS 260.88 / M93) TaxID=1509407 RepID=A0A0L1J3D5_ASPN3|nr:putative flavin-containing amine oxidase [Aspergillus nomiae NRRL 13137]KNG86321.1 putative flavin-containing amine oxidase [Aspergillus nomiae NRRL 13137]